MSVTINTSNTTPIKQALSNSLAASAMSATKMATGAEYQHFYEDPTSNAIGLNMRSDLGVLQTVLKGIEQSQSMLYIAEAGAKSIYATVNKMKEILTQAKLGYMTDQLVQTTLSPTYVQLKAEINRIADSVNFNGQTLINGQGGTQNAGTASTVASTATYTAGSNSVVSLAPYAGTSATPVSFLSGLSATTVTGGTAGTVTFQTSSSLSPVVSGGTISTDASGNINVTGATLTYNGVTVKDSAGTPNTGTGNLVVTGVNLQFAAANFTFANGVISAKTAAAPTITNTGATALAATNFSFTSTGGTITAVSGLSGTPALTAIPNGTGSSINNMTQTYNLSGGVGSTSGFSFVTGSDLNTQIITFNLPNMRLNGITPVGSSAQVLGMINTINTSQNTLSAAPKDLTNLQTIANADTDIPLVEALLQNIIGQLDQLGAYETRLINVQVQLQSDVEQVDSAQGVFMNADLANQTENFTKANVKVNVAISCLKNLNNSLQALQQLAQ